MKSRAASGVAEPGDHRITFASIMGLPLFETAQLLRAAAVPLAL